MRTHSRDLGVSITAGELQLDVAVEVLEALIAGQLGFCRSEQSAEQIVESSRSGVVHDVSPSRAKVG
jgi:hypothetical protein